ncbi:MAG: hypothetical protein FWE39_20855, partial [Nocardiaceae bacterium]|nr:hypothetical protein [Nocardiaceae bacterium]
MNPTEHKPITIRDRRDDDLPVIVDLALESLSWHAETFDDIRPAPGREALAHDFEQLTESTELYFRVAELAGTVIA